MIHRNSPRASQPFVAVDCGSIAPACSRASCSGPCAEPSRAPSGTASGVFEAASRGTVFLDEIGDVEFELPVEASAVSAGSGDPPRRSAALKSGGRAGNRSHQPGPSPEGGRGHVSARICGSGSTWCASWVPPLRERKGDVPLLVQYFLQKYNHRYGQQTRLTTSGLKAMQDHIWPGKRAPVAAHGERLSILAPGGWIDEASVKEAIASSEPRDRGLSPLADTETDQIGGCCPAAGGNKSGRRRYWGSSAKRSTEAGTHGL